MIKQLLKLFVQVAILSGLSFLFLGCVAGPTLQTQGGCFHNNTGFPIEDVKLRVLEDRREASCSYVGAGGYFSIQLSERTYIEKEIEISWVCRGKMYREGPFVIPVPDPVPDEPAVVVVQIYPDGNAVAEFFPMSRVPLFNK